MHSETVHIVTGAYGFSGKYIARRLLEAGRQVRTLTNSLTRSNPFNGTLSAFPFNFDDPRKLIESLRGATVLYNNYWVRFNHADFTYSEAVDNSRILFDAAKEAGIQRIVHISITNPSEDSRFEYFSGNAKIERMLIESGISYAILRPAVIFGPEDILINNIAWFLRKFPVFGVFGNGEYRLQPIHVDDLAKLAVAQGQKRENCIIDAIGPETYTYRALVKELGRAIGKSRPLISMPPIVGYSIGAMIGKLVGDVAITHDEIEGLMANLLYTESSPVGERRLSDWVREHAATIGMRYNNELARRNNRLKSYEHL